jgi:hypothetical protein
MTVDHIITVIFFVFWFNRFFFLIIYFIPGGQHGLQKHKTAVSQPMKAEEKTVFEERIE